MEDSIDLQKAIAEYLKLAYTFTQITSGEAAEPLREFWRRAVVKRDENTWLNEGEHRGWLAFDVHMVRQMWGSTAGGWPGMGGAAMSEYYTTIIENPEYGFVCVYYGGRLAYICEMDDKYKEFMGQRLKFLPSISESRKKLTVLFTGR